MKQSTTESPDRVSTKVDVEDLGTCIKKLTITVLGSDVSDQLTGSMDTLVMEAAIPGFRLGRAPRRLVEKKFGSAMRKEAKGQIVAGAFSDAIDQTKLNVIGDPEPGDELDGLEVEPGKDFVFSVTVEVAPEFELPDFDGLEIFKPLLEATDENADDYITRLQLNEGKLQAHDKVGPGDYCVGHGILRDEEGEVHLDVPGAVIQCPPEGEGPGGQILGIKVDDFAKQLGSPTAGDQVTIKVVGPESHETEKIRGKDLTIEFNVEQVQHIVPATVDELVQKFGLENEKQLRESVMLRLNQRAVVEQQSVMRKQVTRHLIDGASFEVPERITARQSARNIERARLELLYRGVDASETESRLADIRSSSSEVAQRELKLFFVLQKVAGEMSIEVTDEEIMGRIAQMASERGERPEKLRKELMQRNQISMLAQQIREHKALDAVVNKAKVVEVSPEEFSVKLKAKWGDDEGELDGASKGKSATTTKKKTKKKVKKKTSTKS